MPEGGWVRENLKEWEDNLRKQLVWREGLILSQLCCQSGKRGSRVTRSPSAFPVVLQHIPANGVEQGYAEIGWHPTEMIDRRHFKEGIISYGMHSPYVKQILNNWATQN